MSLPMPIPPYGFTYEEDAFYMRGRRVVDVLVSTVALVLLSPVLAVAAAAIKLEDRGPVLFVQMRVGRFGRLFPMLKLRTMRISDCGDAVKPASGADPRITKVGRYLRRLSIDELPQFFNVLRGDMTLVGPRPEMPFVVREYAAWQQLRHIACPGITGLWQVTCRSTISLHRPEATALDVEYILRGSLIGDLAIMLRTFPSLLSARGAR
jgi:lipopolysaccharide/colanic/teichoic acid biosynthesis glycosyltransferase